MNIELTQEQAEAFGRGESITLTPKPKQWEPRGGVWGAILRQAKEAVEKERDAMRTHNPLLAYVYEFGGDWVADWEDADQAKYSLYYDYCSRRWHVDTNHVYCVSGAVYMSQDCAKDLAAKLNSGKVVT